MRTLPSWSSPSLAAVCAVLLLLPGAGQKRQSASRRAGRPAGSVRSKALHKKPSPPKPPPLPTGEALLRRVLLAEEQVPFEAIQTAILPSGQRSQATITHEIHLGQRRSRIEYRMPKSAAGQVIITDGRWRWEVRPRENKIVRTPAAWEPISAATVERIVTRVLRSYSLRVNPAPATVSGRPTYVLEMRPVLNDRDRQVWWVDQTTSIVLKRDEHDVTGPLEAESTFSSISYRIKPAQQALLQPPIGLRVVTKREEPPVTSVEAARRIAPAWTPIPPALGRGFEFDSATVTRVKGAPTTHLHYSDGLVGLSLYFMQGRATVTPGDQPSRPVRIKGAAGTLTHHTRYAILTWSMPGHTCSLVGDLAESALLEIARRLP